MNTLKEMIEKKFEFSEHEAYYRLGYDSEKEPGVKFIIEGARGEFNQLKSEVLPILLECSELLSRFEYVTVRNNCDECGTFSNEQYHNTQVTQALERLRKWSEDV